MSTFHISRSWSGHPLEDECPCPKAPCGLVDMDRTSPDCPEHPAERGKSMRQMHPLSECPSPPAGKPCTGPDCPECRVFDEEN